MKEQYPNISTQELIANALETSNEDEDKYWEYIRELHIRGSKEVLNQAKNLCLSDLTQQKVTGADILAQLGVPKRNFPNDVLEILYRLIRHKNQDSKVLNSALVAIGHTQDTNSTEGLDYIIKLETHPDANVRLGVVLALWGHEDSSSINSMLSLTRDKDDNVRDWATTGIGSIIDADTPEIRHALWERVETEVEEESHDTYCEAVMGLATRKDPNIYKEILKKIEENDPTTLIFDAATELEDLRLLAPFEDYFQNIKNEKDLNEAWLNTLMESIAKLKNIQPEKK
jgi:HEAT repeat protein